MTSLLHAIKVQNHVTLDYIAEDIFSEEDIAQSTIPTVREFRRDHDWDELMGCNGDALEEGDEIQCLNGRLILQSDDDGDLFFEIAEIQDYQDYALKHDLYAQFVDSQNGKTALKKSESFRK